MPPKKKQTVTSTASFSGVPPQNLVIPPLTPSTSTTTTTTTTTTNNSNGSNGSTSTAASTSSGSASGKVIKWYWAGDSSSGSQDILVEYDAKVTKELEESYQAHLKDKRKRKHKLDTERYVDLKEMTQRRYDDKNKQRTVERKEVDLSTISSATQKPGSLPTSESGGSAAASTKSTTKKRAISNSTDKSDSDSDESDKSDDDDDDDYEYDEDYHATWYWAGDSGGGPAKGGGHQDIWVKYDLKFAKELEKSFNSGVQKLKVDKDRFIDFQNMLQRRYDDENKRRNVKRVDPVKKKPTKPSATTTTTTTSTPVTASILTPTAASSSSNSLANLLPSTNVNIPTAAQQQSMQMAQVLKCPNTWTNVSMDYQEVDVNPNATEFNWMSDLFTDTISHFHKGQTTLSPIVFNSLKVTRVVRIQNPSIWLRYHSRKQKILDDNHGKCTYVPSILTNLPNGPEVDKNANETYLFHGLNVSSITGITKFGFDPRFCSLEGMFGAGLYFAENSSKSNQYCHAGACTCSGFQAISCKCSIKDEMCLLVCRVTLGDSLIENVFRGNSTGQFWNGRRTEPKKSDGVSVYNSVIGESKANYGNKASLQLREYIVYESGQVYPEYKVYFKRVK